MSTRPKSDEPFENEPELKVGGDFSDDLGVLFSTDKPVPPEVDRVIVGMGRRHLMASKRRRLPVLRWVGAAAAVVLLALGLSFLGSETERSSELAGYVVRTDVDRNGRVNILDAFALARHVEGTDPKATKWDFNDDGSVDHKDVDLVAFAAVRLDKGVL